MMTVITIISILVSVLFSVIAQILLKYGMSNITTNNMGWFDVGYSVLTNGFVVLGLTCYGMSMVTWLYVLTKVDVSKAYPFVGLGFIGTMLFAHYFLNEAVTVSKLIGTLMVVAGVILLAK